MAGADGTDRFPGETEVWKASEVPLTPITTARYSHLRHHASGGLGDVFRANDETLCREVALKFIQPRHEGNTDLLDQFLTEAEITSRLDHPGVVPVYGLGQSEGGRPFYAMRFIEGMPLKSAIDACHGSADSHRRMHQLLTHLVAVCKTAAYAHNRGIVHRDIKPDNIMIGRFGETLLVDWGLAVSVQRDERARASGEKTILLRGTSESGRSSGGGAGTIGYMSPEQLPDSPGPITTASDVYSLGATLYRVLTNRTPIHGEDESLLVDKLRWGDFPRPREVNRDVPPALEAVCLKAMATEPSARYAGALEMALDLEAWLADEPVSVYRAPWSDRLVRWGRTHRHWVVMATMAALMMVLGTLGAALYLHQLAAVEATARLAADAARGEAEAARRFAEEAQHDGMRLAARFAARTVANEIDLRWRVLSQAAAAPELRQMMLAVEGKGAGSPEQRRLQAWIESRSKEQALDAESWFLTDARGVQVAREPFSRASLYENYSYRTYFHGGPRPVAPGTPTRPITAPHLSNVYHSTSTGTLKVAFSVPIWSEGDATGDCIGVLAMTVELGTFRELQTSLNAGQIAVLIDTREDQVEEEPRRGLILHHRDLAQALQRKLVAGDESFFRVRPAQVDELLRLRKLRSREAGMSQQAAAGGDGRVDLAGSLATDYRDPLAPDGSPAVVAAFEPVRIENRPAEIRDTGWVVSVQQDPRMRLIRSGPEGSRAVAR